MQFTAKKQIFEKIDTVLDRTLYHKEELVLEGVIKNYAKLYYSSSKTPTLSGFMRLK